MSPLSALFVCGTLCGLCSGAAASVITVTVPPTSCEILSYNITANSVTYALTVTKVVASGGNCTQSAILCVLALFAEPFAGHLGRLLCCPLIGLPELSAAGPRSRRPGQSGRCLHAVHCPRKHRAAPQYINHSHAARCTHVAGR